MTQNEMILDHLKSGRAIDPMTALQKFACMRLAARILELRQLGHNILAVKKSVTNRNGEQCSICIYKLIPKG
jgi:Helix-turn-helix domain